MPRFHYQVTLIEYVSNEKATKCILLQYEHDIVE